MLSPNIPYVKLKPRGDSRGKPQGVCFFLANLKSELKFRSKHSYLAYQTFNIKDGLLFHNPPKEKFIWNLSTVPIFMTALFLLIIWIHNIFNHLTTRTSNLWDVNDDEDDDEKPLLWLLVKNSL